MKRTLRIVLALVLTLGLMGGALAGEVDLAQIEQLQKKLNYPTRTIEFVIPFGAAGSADICFRSVADVMSKLLKTNISIANKPGAGGVTGLSYAFDHDADGYTLCAVTPSMAIAEAKGAFPFTEEFVPVALMEMDLFVVSTLTSNPYFTDFEGFVEYAKANPGAVTIGGTSSGGLDEYQARQFGDACGVELTFVPYDSGGEHKAAVLGGEIVLYMDKLSSFTSMLQYEQIKPIIVIYHERLNVEELKDVPCTVEKGIDFTTGSWMGLVVRKGTPSEIVDFLTQVCEAVYWSEAFQQTLKNDNADIIYGFKNAEDFAKLITEEVEAYTAVVAKYSTVK